MFQNKNATGGNGASYRHEAVGGCSGFPSLPVGVAPKTHKGVGPEIHGAVGVGVPKLNPLVEA